MGNNKSKFGIYIKTQMSFYLPGELVQGNIYINAPTPLEISKLVLNINGNENIWWKADNPQPNKEQLKQSTATNNSINQKPNSFKIPLIGDRFSDKIIFKSTYQIKSFDKNSTLHGQFTFPFQFRLPTYIPGSFNQTTPDHKASIIYQISCTCVSTLRPQDNITQTQQLIVRQIQKGPEKLLFGQVYIEPQTCCNCFQQGVSRICCTFQKNQFIPGENCVAKCQIDNYKCNLKIREIKIKFKKIVILTSDFGQQKFFITDITSSSFPGIQPFHQYIDINAKKIIIPLTYKKSQISLHPTTNGRLVKCHYCFEIIPVMTGCCVTGVNSFKVDLQIVQPGLPPLQIEKPVDWNPEIYRKSQIVLDCPLDNELLNLN